MHSYSQMSLPSHRWLQRLLSSRLVYFPPPSILRQTLQLYVQIGLFFFCLAYFFQNVTIYIDKIKNISYNYGHEICMITVHLKKSIVYYGLFKYKRM